MALLLNAGDTVSRSYSYTQPSPLHPSLPQGTGERTGNLLNANSYYASYKSGNSYTATTSQFNTTIISPFTTSDIGKTYTISCDITEISSTNVRWLATINGISLNGDGRSNTGQIKLTFTVETENDSFKITYGSGNYTLTIANVMMNEGSTPLPFEPYGYKIPISSANTTTPVYLGEVQTTRKIKKTVLDGTETTWTSGTVQGRMNFNWKTGTQNPNGANVLCTHYKSEYAIREGVCFITSNNVAFVDSNFQSLDDFKNYLAAQYANGTPVTIWYVLATEETGIVNEPLMKIGNYADTVSGITIPTIAGANSFDVLTTLKPSEVTVNYKGWHTGAVHERENGAWT